MSSPVWQDRRGMFQKGREIHEPSKPAERRPSGGSTVMEAVRRASVTSNSGLEKTTSNVSDGSPPSSSGQRRRPSNTGLFGGLTNTKRGSQDYGERRASHGDTQASSAFGGWYNKTFRGIQGPQGSQDQQAAEQSGQQEERRGVME